MPTPSPNDITAKLAPDAARYSKGPFTLADDLARLDRAWRADAPEGAILYGARVLEFLTGDALLKVGLRTERKAAADLGVLQQFNLAPAAAFSWAHALRRIGNDARHIRRRLAAADADMALMFLERWLTWFFCRFRFGHGLGALTHDGRHVWQISDELQHILAALEAPDCRASAVLDEVRRQGAGSPFYRSSALPAVLAEMLLGGGGDPQEADEVLRPALERFPDDLRLRQLRGLHLSRTGRHDDALTVLTPLRRQYPRDGDDSETEGIVAGVFKRQGRIKQSHEAYARGWNFSDRTSIYLGVNAATTALWLGRADEALRIGGAVRDRLRARVNRLAKRDDRSDVILSYWDQASLAEAHLLTNAIPAAAGAYQLAFARYPHEKQNHEVTRGQAMRILEKLGLTAQAPDILG